MSSALAAAPQADLPSEDATGHLELLRRVTEQMTVHRKLGDVLDAITRGLVASADAALARIWLFTTEGACATCRGPAGERPALEAPSLHLCASAGVFADVAGPHHRVPLGMFLGGRVAELREPLLLNDLAGEPRVRSLPWVAEHGLSAYAGYPLVFRGQLEGVLGIFRRRPFARILSVEHRIYPEALRLLAKGMVRLEGDLCRTSVVQQADQSLIWPMVP